MPKPRMKNFDVKSVGGRIRKARIEAGMTMRELSEKMEVSFAYLGMVERNEKKPSDKILTRVAEATGVSLGWLQDGDGDGVAEKASKPTQSQPLRIADIDASLFLSLIMREDPSVSEEMIATFLNVDQCALKDILAGTLKFDPAWKPAFTTLAQRLKIPDVLDKLYVVVSFLERVEMEKVDSALLKAIKSSLSEKIGEEFTWLEELNNYREYVDIRESYKGKGVPVRSFTFMQKPTATRWNVALYSELHGSTLEQMLSNLKNPSDDIIINEGNGTAHIVDTCDVENEAVIFIKEENFREALSFADKFARGRDNLPIVAAMLLDPDTMHIECELI